MSLTDDLDMPRRKTHRGRRSKGKGPKQHHAEAKGHMANAQNAPTPAGAMGHLFKAVRSLHAAKAQPDDAEPSGNALL